jgi:RluA family pseudouridine synthase
MSDRGFDILLEDDAILAVVKPPGIATQAPAGIDSLEVRIKTYLTSASQAVADVYLGIPHRLDRPVSGVMVFAKTRRAARQLSRQFERRRVKKSYWALVEGQVEPLEGIWTDCLWKVYGQPRTMVVASAHPEGQQAVLRYRTIGRHRQGSWLEIELETGRTHQVRVQCSSRGWPVVGDELYGATTSFGTRPSDERSRAIALHARSLMLLHPNTKEELTLIAPTSALWNEIETRLEER